MAQRCSICSHSRKEEIDRDLLGAEPMRVIAERYRLAESSVQRHRARHLMPKAAAAISRHEEQTLERLLAFMTGLQDQTAATILVLKARGEYAEARGWMKEARANTALIAKLKGYIDQGPHVVVDARQQTLAMLDGVDVEDLRTLAAAHRAGELEPPVVEGQGVSAR
jgi:hypothetical protein